MNKLGKVFDGLITVQKLLIGVQAVVMGIMIIHKGIAGK